MEDRLKGVRTTAELLSAGLSAGRIRRLVRDGALCSLRPGVYATAATVSFLVRDARDERARQAGEQLLRLAATLAVTGSRSAGSHRSAALVYGLGLVGRGPESAAEITRAPGDRGSYTGRRGVLVHIAALPADHVVSYRGVPLTSVPRTVVDLARTLPFAQGVAVADSALHAGLTSKSELAAVIADCARWRGLRQARDVAAFSDARSESVLESLSRVVFHQARLPPPDLQVWVGDDGEVIGRVDFLWRRYGTIGEADGAFKYETPARARAQLDRDARLRAAGYEVVHFGWPEITRVPAQVVDSIRLAFSRCGAG
ncbi:MAG: hypothetical protein ACRDMI_13985 [Streptosporangiaceae bacterium]